MVNGGKKDSAMPTAGGRPEGCKQLMYRKKQLELKSKGHDGKERIRNRELRTSSMSNKKGENVSKNTRKEDKQRKDEERYRTISVWHERYGKCDLFETCVYMC